MEIKSLSCPLCSNPHFDSVDALRTTLVSVATSPLPCPVCSETLLGLDKLTIHLFRHINGANNPQEKFKEEIDKSIDDISKCGKSDESAAENVPKIDEIRCDICSFSFTDKNILDMHQKLLHQTSPDKTGTYSYHCHLCSKKFRMRGSLMVHLRVAHYGFGQNNSEDNECPNTRRIKSVENQEPQESEKDGSMVDMENVQKSPNVKQDNKQWECDVCSKYFTTKYFLKKHKRLHTGEMPYCCSLCNKSFTFQQSYHKHMLYHSSEKPYVCNECGRAFKELSTLQNHARIHSGERPFSCETCGKSFRQRVSYLVHRRIHTGVMPYKCTACGKSFRYKVSQKSHKCPMIPPGSVIRVPENEGNSTQQMDVSSNHERSVSIELGNGIVNSTEKNQNTEDTSLIQKTSIVLSNNQQIEISYNRADLQSAIDRVVVLQEDPNGGNGCLQKGSQTPDQTDVMKLVYTERDLFSMVLSPLLPDVESLCLNHSSPTNSPTSPVREDVHLIGGKCLEDFL